MTDKIEYKAQEFDPNKPVFDLEAELNKLGEEGWMLIDFAGRPNVTSFVGVFTRKPGAAPAAPAAKRSG